MLYRITRRHEKPQIEFEGFGLVCGEPEPFMRERILNEAMRWALEVTVVENNRHLCYNHLTDYGWTKRTPISDPVYTDGEFCGALLRLEDEFELGHGIKTQSRRVLLTTDGRAFGRPEAEFIYSASACGRSRSEEYRLVRTDPVKSLLVTGFEPFGGERVNPTELILCDLPESVLGMRVNRLLLPVEFRRAPELLLNEYERLHPDCVIMLGQAGGRCAITPECRAVNLMDARIPDNAGFRPEGAKITEDGEESLCSTIGAEILCRAVKSKGLPAEQSQSAGTYVCNTVMYSMLERCRFRTPAVFIHVPYIREQVEGRKPAGTPFIELADMKRGILAAIEEAVWSLDRQIQAGQH